MCQYGKKRVFSSGPDCQPVIQYESGGPDQRTTPARTVASVHQFCILTCRGSLLPWTRAQYRKRRHSSVIRICPEKDAPPQSSGGDAAEYSLQTQALSHAVGLCPARACHLRVCRSGTCRSRLGWEPTCHVCLLLNRTQREDLFSEPHSMDGRWRVFSSLIQTHRRSSRLGQDVPDLVLLSALLSPSDEDELFECLRTLPDSTHVQTLTIPQIRATTESQAAIQVCAVSGVVETSETWAVANPRYSPNRFRSIWIERKT